MDNIYIFPNVVRRKSEKERFKVNIEGKEIYLLYDCGDGAEQIVLIDTEILRDGSSTMVLNNSITGNTYALYNFREILQVMDMIPSEFLSVMGQRGFMQIDKSGGDVFVKVFLLEGERSLASDINDFSRYEHCTKDYILPLDWRYSWTLGDVKAHVEGDKLKLELELIESEFWKSGVYASHGGQYILLSPGKNNIEFRFNPHENVYLGSPNCRYTGRAIDVKRLLEEKH